MDDKQLLRYSRQILLKNIDIEGQERLLNSRALIMGLGGLGSPIAMYLAAAGVGEIVLVDFDRVDLTNLQRQIVHRTDSVSQLKVESARQTLHAINPDIQITCIAEKLNDKQLLEQVRKADVVLDGTDNFSTRLAVNRACVLAQTPLVWGAAIRMEGQVSIYDPRQPNCPCYQCLYQHADYETEACSQMGVFTPVVGMIGTVQACEALKILIGLEETLAGHLLLLDAESIEWNKIPLQRKPSCPICGDAATP